MALSGEFELIDLIRGAVGPPSKRVLVGIGDDAAVVTSPRGRMVATVDTLVEGVHFDLAYTGPRELGQKALAVNLSDIAATGATPLYALISLGLPQHLSDPFVLELYNGIRRLAKTSRVDIIGGNLTQSPQVLVIDITLIGETKRYLTRDSAKVGDVLCVTGTLGLSAAGLNYLKRFGRSMHGEAPFTSAFERHLTPTPRVAEGRILNKETGVHAVIDISDGFAKELHHLCQASGVGARVEEADLPVAPETKRVAEFLGTDSRKWVLFGGEDYELLFTAAPKSIAPLQKAFAKLGSSFKVVGQILPKKAGIHLRSMEDKLSPLAPKGWNHFVRRKPMPTT